MKKILCMLLTLALALSMLAACGGSGEAAQTDAATANTFRVGYASAFTSPTESLPLGGYNDSLERWSTAIEYPFEVVCVAFADANGETVLYLTLDLLLCFSYVSTMRDAIATATGLPKNRVMVHCDHNHSGPDMLLQEQPTIISFGMMLNKAAVDVAKAALEDLKPAQMYGTFCRPEKHNFVRHYLLADGNYQAEGVGAVPKEDLIGHATAPDNLLQVIKFTREGGKDVVMVNWAGHPPGTDPRTIATGNYYSVLRQYLNKNMDCQSVFVLSGSGNINNNSQIPGEVAHENYIELGEALGAAAVEASQNFVPLNLGELQITENILRLKNKAGNEPEIPLYAIAMGDFAMALAPFEIFDTNAVGVREDSDFKMTFYSSCTNASRGYLPTPQSFDWEIAYEVRITEYPMGTAERIQQELTDMLAAQFAATGNQVTEKPEGYLHTDPVPETDGVTYTVPDPGNLTAYEAVNNGFFQIVLLNGMTMKKILVEDEALAQEILSKDSLQLVFDYRGVVVGIQP